MKFQNCILINFERMNAETEGWTEGRLTVRYFLGTYSAISEI